MHVFMGALYFLHLELRKIYFSFVPVEEKYATWDINYREGVPVNHLQQATIIEDD